MKKQSLMNHGVSKLVKHSVTAACIAAGISSTSLAQSPLVLDDFLFSTNSQAIDSRLVNPSASFQLTNAETIGGTRDVSLTSNYLFGDSFVFQTSTASFTSAGGRESGTSFDLPSGFANDDIDWEFVYFANGTGLASDFNAYQEIVLLWEGQNFTASNDSSVSLILEDSLGNLHTEPITFVAGTEPTGINTVKTTRWSLNSFSAAGVNLSDVDKITLSGNTALANDVTFSSLSAQVPEPSTTVMVALSMGAFLLRRKRSC